MNQIRVREGAPLSETASLLKLDIQEKGAAAEARLAAGRERLSQLDPSNLHEAFQPAASDHDRHGRPRQALAVYEEWARALKDKLPDDHYRRVILLGKQAMAWMRIATYENEIETNHAGASTVPLREDGRHRNPEAAARAVDLWTAYLRLRPTDAIARWLLNLSAMLAGTWPDAVQEAWRLPQDVFDGEVECPPFEDVAPSLGMDVLSCAGGVVAEDFDGDGFTDILFSGWTPTEPMRLFMNKGNGAFEDFTHESGLVGQFGGLNMNSADIDNDGDVDVYVLRGAWGGPQRNSLLRNNGDATFEDVTDAAGLAWPARSGQAGDWADYDLDGDLDLYLGVETRDTPQPELGNALYRNNGDGTFTNVAPEAGVAVTAFCKGVAWSDINNDGYPDLFLSILRDRNRLFLNAGDGTFRDVTTAWGLEGAIRSFPCWSMDADQDGDQDLFVATYDASMDTIWQNALGKDHTSPRLTYYRNENGKRFTDATREANLYRSHLVMGCNVGDLTNNGYPDMYLGTGAPSYSALVPNVLLLNDGTGRYEDATGAARMGHLQKGHGIAFADLDNDGDLDVVFEAGGAKPGDAYPNAIYKNPGFGGHWLAIDLRGTESNSLGVGCRILVVAEKADGTPVIRHLEAGTGGSFGTNPHRQHIGLGDSHRIVSLEVTWPASGRQQTLTEVPIDAVIRVREDATAVEVVPAPRFDL